MTFFSKARYSDASCTSPFSNPNNAGSIPVAPPNPELPLTDQSFIPLCQLQASDFNVVELVLGDKPIRAKIDLGSLPEVLNVSTRWRGYWHPGSRTHYVCAVVNNRKIYLHRVVTGAPDGLEVDHIRHDALDNRRSAIRLTTRSENVRNTRSRPNKHGYRGIGWYAPLSKWRSLAKVNGKSKHLGYFSTKEDAAAAYRRFFDERMGVRS